MGIALKIIAIILFTIVFGDLLYMWRGLGKWFYHDILRWHMPTDSQGFDGCSFTSTCKYCGKEIMQDSQGNWF